jgi:hypothetical protein
MRTFYVEIKRVGTEQFYPGIEKFYHNFVRITNILRDFPRNMPPLTVESDLNLISTPSSFFRTKA